MTMNLYFLIILNSFQGLEPYMTFLNGLHCFCPVKTAWILFQVLYIRSMPHFMPF